MSSESKLVVELWDYFRDMIASGKRQEAALHLLRLFEEYGIEIKPSDVEGECDYLDYAVEALHENEGDDYNDSEDDDNDY
jgi:hypothetical protein